MTRHYYIHVDKSYEEGDDLECVANILQCADTYAIIFCNTNHNVNWLDENLRSYKLSQAIMSLHGGMSQEKQKNTVAEFYQYSSIFITSNIMARNCACCNLVEAPLVINFDLPRHLDIYKHRASRAIDFTNRNDNEKPGVVINLYDEDEDDTTLEELENLYNVELKLCPNYAQLADMF